MNMMIIALVGVVWLWLMIRSTLAEYQYYQSVKLLEPEIWAKLGKPKQGKVFIAFLSRKNAQILTGITQKEVIDSRRKYQQTGRLFLSYVVSVLALAIVYFTYA